ncbi:hypothetical protein M011DRAFT_98320 [Sporormia fimetaria CBS 119925]|uniref:Uncharacterized protein n=1 Tax=Sporormia fimetaria CBS 119925 TaxID=1340428 RepID=A0A6A6VAD4_9PLEO|nr:hypothetical protein M011DRAFT_98320 [Sporormia fimetaria CBS 119925]
MSGKACHLDDDDCQPLSFQLRSSYASTVDELTDALHIFERRGRGYVSLSRTTPSIDPAGFWSSGVRVSISTVSCCSWFLGSFGDAVATNFIGRQDGEQGIVQLREPWSSWSQWSNSHSVARVARLSANQRAAVPRGFASIPCACNKPLLLTLSLHAEHSMMNKRRTYLA